MRMVEGGRAAVPLSIEGLWWRYPAYSDGPNPWILRGVDLRVEPGECLGMCGASGAGKTTLCRAILGSIPYSARLSAEQLPQHFRGAVAIDGEPVGAASSSGGRVGMVLQDPENQFLRMSLLHELALGMQLQGLAGAEILQRAHAALVEVGLEHLWHGAVYLHPADLSGGQKQRVAIAAFLALRPRLLILDEPTSDLDPKGKREVIETIGRLRQQFAMTILLVEQDAEILAAFCDRIALLRAGRIALVAPPPAFFAQQGLLEESGAPVGELIRISWRTGRSYQSRPPLTLAEAESAFAPHLRRLPSPPEHPEPLSPPEHPEPLVVGEDIWYAYEDGSPALRGVDITLYRGEMLALLGPNGSGKTTLAKILAGIYRPARGRVRVLGQDLASRRTRRRLPSSLGYVFQNPDHQLFRRKVSDEVAYGLTNLGVPSQLRQLEVERALATVGLARYAAEDPLFLGKGQRQRLAVASVLAMGPQILIVDEPTTGQDYRMAESIMALLRDLQRQGKTILLITHDMTLVAEHCQRVVAFRAGKQVFGGTPAELFRSEETLNAVGLRPPPSAALSVRLRSRDPALPFFYTVDQWVRALGALEAQS
jgi:energy-coupling factor transport system ATP-binding protein